MELVADEHVPSAVINALRSGYNVRHAAEEYTQGDDDPELLQNCTSDGYVLLTNDRDFVRVADRIEHFGVIIYTDQKRSPREVLKGIRSIDDAYSGDLENRIVWLGEWI